MSNYKIYAKFSTVIEKKVAKLNADTELEAINKAYELEEAVMDDLRKKYGDSVELEEFIAVKEE